MTKQIKEYIKYIDDVIKEKKIDKNIKDDILIKIKFYQHERLIYLLVTLAYAIFLIAFIFLTSINPLFVIIVLILIIFLIFYVKHYFFLENSVQYMYTQYDIINNKLNK